MHITFIDFSLKNHHKEEVLNFVYKNDCYNLFYFNAIYQTFFYNLKFATQDFCWQKW